MNMNGQIMTSHFIVENTKKGDGSFDGRFGSGKIVNVGHYVKDGRIN